MSAGPAFSSGADWTGHDLGADPQAVWVQKKPVTVSVVFAGADGVLETLEGPVRYTAGDALLTGSAGERWPVGRQRFLASYEPGPGITEGAGGKYRKRPLRVRARRMESEFSVRAGSAGDVLRGRPGDWLVQYGAGDYGVVGAPQFDATYLVLDQLGKPASR